PSRRVRGALPDPAGRRPSRRPGYRRHRPGALELGARGSRALGLESLAQGLGRVALGRRDPPGDRRRERGGGLMARILVVEDSPDIRELIRMLLEPSGHRLFFAADGREGISAAGRESPDLVRMDLPLPVVRGGGAPRQIKNAPETASSIVLAVTAHAMQGDRDRALAAGCDGFLSKPIDEETFDREI